MKKIFVIAFCFISFSVFAEHGFTLLPRDFQNADIRNNVWFFGTDSFPMQETFLAEFTQAHMRRIIMEYDFRGLPEPYLSMCRDLLNRGRGMPLPATVHMFLIITNDTHGVLIWWWNDRADFMGGPALRTMLRQFFELEPVNW